MARKRNNTAQEPASEASSGAGEVLTQAEEQESQAEPQAEAQEAPAQGLEVSPPDAPGEDAATAQEDVVDEIYGVHLNPDFGDRQQLVIVGDQKFYANQTYKLTYEQYQEAKDAELDGLPVLKEGGVE